MNSIRRIVVAALLAVWCFPAVSLAKSEPAQPAPVAAQMASRSAPAGSETSQVASSAEVQDLAAREKQAPELQDFKGGAAIIIGGGALLVVLLLLVLLV
jgi:hypothetical protein